MALRCTLTVLAFGLALASPAAARTAVTPPVHNDVDRVGCVVQNRGPTPRTVAATLRNLLGTPISSFSLEVPPGAALELVFTASFQPAVYCEFNGTSKKVRGFLEVQSAGGGTTQVLLPAD